MVSAESTQGPDTATEKSPRRIGKVEISVGIGNFMEWFEFAIYGYFAKVIGDQFFPSENPTASLLATFAVFAVGFFARPIGGLILGPIGDKFGRRQVLLISVGLMGIATMGIGLVPSYHSIGIIAPILVLSFRILQGIAAGGEWSSASAYIVECAPEGKRAVRGSIISLTAGLAFLAGVLVATLLSAVLAAEALSNWGWRIPFIASIALSGVAVYIRLKLEDTPVYEALESRRERGQVSTVPVGKQLHSIVLAVSTSALFGVSLYFFVTYMSTYLQNVNGMAPAAALAVCSVALAVYVSLNPAAGMLLDRLGRRKPLIAVAAAFTVLGPVFFHLFSTSGPILVTAVLIAFGALVAVTAVCNVVLLVEVFPASVRSRNAALGYNIGIAAFGGTAPFVATYLLSITDNNIAPGFYLSAVAAAAGLVFYRYLPETRTTDIYE